MRWPTKALLLWLVVRVGWARCRGAWQAGTLPYQRVLQILLAAVPVDNTSDEQCNADQAKHNLGWAGGWQAGWCRHTVAVFIDYLARAGLTLAFAAGIAVRNTWFTFIRGAG